VSRRGGGVTGHLTRPRRIWLGAGAATGLKLVGVATPLRLDADGGVGDDRRSTPPASPDDTHLHEEAFAF